MNDKVKVLITSGGTKIKIDAVRSITNMSKGTFGSKIAKEFSDSFFDVTFLHAKDSKLPDLGSNYREQKVYYPEFVTFDDYAHSLEQELDMKPDIIVLAAAVSDYGVENFVGGKIRSSDSMVIKLKPLPKLISTVRKKCPNAVICGFKLLVDSTREELEDAVASSLHKNRCDLVVGNDLSDIRRNNHKLLISKWLHPMVWDEDKMTEHGMYGFGFTTTEYTQPEYNLAKVVASECLKIHKEKNEKEIE